MLYPFDPNPAIGVATPATVLKKSITRNLATRIKIAQGRTFEKAEQGSVVEQGRELLT